MPAPELLGSAYGAGAMYGRRQSPAGTQRTTTTAGGVTGGTPRSQGRDYVVTPRQQELTSWAIKPDTFTGPPGSRTPGPSSDYRGRTTPLAPGADPNVNKGGSQTGPGILESWFNQRAMGEDPAFNYGIQRGNEQIANQYGAAGAFNSGAARRAESDLYANLLSQRMGQLDQLAAGASGEHLGRLGMQFQQGLGLAGGQAGLASAYDLGAAGNMQAANQAQQQMFLNKAGVDQQGNQSAINLFSSIYGGRGGSGGGYGR